MMVEVGVQRHGLSRLLGLVQDADESVDPRVSRVENPVGAHGEALGREAEALDVVHGDEPVADHHDVLRLQVVRVSAGDDNVVEALLALNVSKGFLPSLTGGLERCLGDGVSIRTDSIRAGAEHAIGRADRGRYYLSLLAEYNVIAEVMEGLTKKERLVGVSMDKAFNRRVSRLLEGVQGELGVIRLHVGLGRDKLAEDWVIQRILPVDAAQDVGAISCQYS